MNNTEINLFWFRRDLRLDDNAGLFHVLSSGLPVLPIFIFDDDILLKLDNKEDARVTFIYDEVLRIKQEIESRGGSLLIKRGRPAGIFRELTGRFRISKVFANHDYEPYARNRDDRVGKLLSEQGIRFITFKDQVIFEKDEILKDDGKSYTVFPPYSRRWKSALSGSSFTKHNSAGLTGNFLKMMPMDVPALSSLGFNRSRLTFPPREPDAGILQHYHRDRDFPALQGTSRMGPHLRFGTVSIRKLAEMAHKTNEVFLNELIWREFYMMILWHFPHAAERAFKPQYDRIAWRNDEQQFRAWCEGRTGYPIVDAGMRELNATGYMHNRVRMITASFLARHLLIDWRWGDAWFASKLLDFELSSNNGGWQWAAGTGCDAAPYFRVFNPVLQAEKFDPEKNYIRQWVPEYGTGSYPPPIVEHSRARLLAIETYQKALKPD
ncbi:MAG TPA: deoxyribodipyrimidine photo-lyase [Bacteroidales bacterium]|nr:deoxyribodipyrimidine photo-lyase [Bacteroidales bacterium]